MRRPYVQRHDSRLSIASKALTQASIGHGTPLVLHVDHNVTGVVHDNGCGLLVFAVNRQDRLSMLYSSAAEVADAWHVDPTARAGRRAILEALARNGGCPTPEMVTWVATPDGWTLCHPLATTPFNNTTLGVAAEDDRLLPDGTRWADAEALIRAASERLGCVGVEADHG